MVVEWPRGSDAVKALLLATTAKFIEEWEGDFEGIVEASVANVRGGVE